MNRILFLVIFLFTSTAAILMYVIGQDVKGYEYLQDGIVIPASIAFVFFILLFFGSSNRNTKRKK
ncbi:MAG: hypothetical protein PHQ74_04380 [Crocinitomicaceae bacterium]|nr:hypothetical protein [Crocinitomicaceae bacterium]